MFLVCGRVSWSATAGTVVATSANAPATTLSHRSLDLVLMPVPPPCRGGRTDVARARSTAMGQEGRRPAPSSTKPQGERSAQLSGATRDTLFPDSGNTHVRGRSYLLPSASTLAYLESRNISFPRG